LLLLGPLVAGFIVMARDDQKRAWYDRLSGTVVVKPR
jgi:hypothetical protein